MRPASADMRQPSHRPGRFPVKVNGYVLTNEGYRVWRPGAARLADRDE